MLRATRHSPTQYHGGDIVGLDNLTPERLNLEIQAGGRFVIFQCCISIIVASFKETSNIYFIRPGENAFIKGLPFSLGSLLLGWWGIPWGPIWTISTVVANCRGGRDVTAEVVRSLNAQSFAPPAGAA